METFSYSALSCSYSARYRSQDTSLVLQGDTAKAEAEYQDFLTLWKDADRGIPILKEAKAEYAKLR
jgi:hypothetical protein